jgi:hypothetical protein
MSKVCILIRVYNRVEDLKYCVDIIKDTWKSREYYILVVANGINDGYIIDDGTKAKIDCLIELKNNIGHFNGNSQLLLDGLDSIPEDCDFTLILEADTWLYGDELINKYVKKMVKEHAVWASAQFFRYVRNLATDFAIVKTSFVKERREIFTFTGTPEYYVANYLADYGFKYIYITENMPINLPKYIRKYPFAPTGRFFSFLKSKMVTHHIESLKNKMEDKKFYFNMVSGTNYFDIDNKKSIKLTRLLMSLSVALTVLIPYKGWFVRQKTY